MPQYPIPPEQPLDGTRTGVPAPDRWVTYAADAASLRHLPLVTAGPDGKVEVLRGDQDEVLASLGTRQLDLVLGARAGTRCMLVTNRRDELTLVPTGKNPAGRLEYAQWVSRYRPSPALAAASSTDALVSALRAAATRLEELAADGWDLVRYPAAGHPAYLFLVDTRRLDVAEPQVSPEPESMWADRVHPSEWLADFSK